MNKEGSMKNNQGAYNNGLDGSRLVQFEMKSEHQSVIVQHVRWSEERSLFAQNVQTWHAGVTKKRWEK